MKNIISLFIVLPLIIFCKTHHYSVEDEKLTKIYNSTGPKTYLLSYPISGNSWTRYCLEYITKRPTIYLYPNYIKQVPYANGPLGYIFDVLQTEMSRDPIWKVHNKDDILRLKTYSPDKEKLIFIVRNPKEVLIRNFPVLFNNDKGNFFSILHIQNEFSEYFENIRIYDEWPSENKILIYYEDLISDIESTLKKLCDFFNVDRSIVNSFMEQYNYHVKNELNLYNTQSRKTITNGNKTLYYSNELSREDLKTADLNISFIHPDLWKKYLKRFSSI